MKKVIYLLFGMLLFVIGSFQQVNATPCDYDVGTLYENTICIDEYVSDVAVISNPVYQSNPVEFISTIYVVDPVPLVLVSVTYISTDNSNFMTNANDSYCINEPFSQADLTRLDIGEITCNTHYC